MVCFDWVVQFVTVFFFFFCFFHQQLLLIFPLIYPWYLLLFKCARLGLNIRKVRPKGSHMDGWMYYKGVNGARRFRFMVGGG